MRISKIHINCDLGEGIGNDALIMPYIDACNIACGGHFGDRKSIRETLELAKNEEVAVGTHPSYPDKKNFGRAVMDISSKDLITSIRAQINLFLDVCNEVGIEMNHIKLHGALYNEAARNRDTAQLIIEALEPFQGVQLYTPYKSALADPGKDLFEIVYETFADRTYNDDLSLVSRKLSNSTIKTLSELHKHIDNVFNNGFVMSVNKNRIPIVSDTYCIHGDGPHALEFIQYIRGIND